MPIMPNGVFWNIDDVRGQLRFVENVASAMQRLSGGNTNGEIVATWTAEADQLRSVIAEYEARISA